jgi:hypothetical protein
MRAGPSAHERGEVRLFAGTRFSLTSHHQVVAVDHLGPPTETEDENDLGRRFAYDLRRILRIVGHEPAPDLAAGAADDDGIAAREITVDALDTGRRSTSCAP